MPFDTHFTLDDQLRDLFVVVNLLLSHFNIGCSFDFKNVNKCSNRSAFTYQRVGGCCRFFVSSCAKFIHEHLIGLSTAALRSKQAVRVAKQYASAPCKLTISSCLFARWHLFRLLAISDISNKLTFDLLTLKVVSESRVTWATSVPILVFLGLSVLDLGPIYATDREDIRQTSERRQTKASHNNKENCTE